MFFKALRKKINNKKGASIAIALMLFLCCAIVSTIIISAATVVSGRMSELKEQEGTYLITAGITNIMIEDLKGLQVTYDTASKTTSASKSGGEMADTNGIVDFVCRAVKDVSQNKGSSSYDGYEGTIVYSSDSPAFSLTCILEMDENYNIVITTKGVDDTKYSSDTAYNIRLVSYSSLTDTDSNKNTINIMYTDLRLEEN